MSSEPRLIVVCGLRVEANIAAGIGAGDPRVAILVGGGNSRGLAADLDRLAPRASALLSFGVAGGLAPEVKPGAIRVASAIIAPDGTRYATAPAWAATAAARLDAGLAVFATVDAPLADVAGKAALYRATRAVNVDMESHIVARAAVAHGLRLAAIRVVTDAAESALPHAATVGMRQDGKVDNRAILLSLAKNPTQLPALVRTGLDARKAFAALLRCRQLLGPSFAFFDL